ncbi:hypothetical protein K503DRAFT_67694 [Rhizopogon vinicolor AM-OR11-026]|uniref:Uncharacterized protein n=1 Tax=Rhizopogon vinicolor AM-OR11-026 TaxID=1314800 RepID=A0A1B7NG47_9AGAM|nr:hypothetical protein K503DRAFT_67694 [Rhizopogon vinicolor AM-OR11-026]
MYKSFQSAPFLTLKKLPTYLLAYPSQSMPPFYEIAVARFGQSSSKAKWVIAVVFTPSSHSLVYQITGSAADYSLEAPQSVTIKEGENDYLGRAPIGLVDSEKLHLLHTTLASIPVIRGNASWNSHNWVMEGIAAMRKVQGYHVDKHVSMQWISERLGGK